jgi:hypothetical protein
VEYGLSEATLYRTSTFGLPLLVIFLCPSSCPFSPEQNTARVESLWRSCEKLVSVDGLEREHIFSKR